MKQVALYSILIISLRCFGQESTFYFDSNWNPTTESLASYYRKCKIDSGLLYFSGRVNDYYSDGKIFMTGAYQNKQKTGQFTFFHENGKVSKTGFYRDNLRSGIWKEYYPNELLKNEVEFLEDGFKIHLLNDSLGNTLLSNGSGKWSEQYYENGNTIIIEGEYKDYKKNGKWECRTSDGIKIYEETYKNGKLIKGINVRGRYTIPSNNHLIEDYSIYCTEKIIPSIIRTIRFHPDKSLNFNPTSDSANLFAIVEEPASPVGGMAAFYKFIGENMRYPADARKKGIEGRVFVKFIVEKDGTLVDITVIKGIGGGCDEEAIRVVKESNKEVKWTPGLQRGKPVRSTFSLAIIFNLG